MASRQSLNRLRGATSAAAIYSGATSLIHHWLAVAISFVQGCHLISISNTSSLDEPGSTGFYWVLLGLTGLYWLLLSFTGFFLVLLGLTGFDWVWLGFTEFSWVILGFNWVWLGLTGFFLVLLGLTGFDWVLLGFTEFSWVILGFNWVWLGLTGLYWFERRFKVCEVIYKRKYRNMGVRLPRAGVIPGPDWEAFVLCAFSCRIWASSSGRGRRFIHSFEPAFVMNGALCVCVCVC